jgi:hypothetical protein
MKFAVLEDVSQAEVHLVSPLSAGQLIAIVGEDAPISSDKFTFRVRRSR